MELVYILNSTLIHIAPKDIIQPLVSHAQHMIQVNREFSQKFYYQEETLQNKEALIETATDDYVAHYRPHVELHLYSYEGYPVDQLTSPNICSFIPNNRDSGRLPYHYYNTLPEDFAELYQKEKEAYESCTGSKRKFTSPKRDELIYRSPEYPNPRLTRKRELIPPKSVTPKLKKTKIINLVD